MIATNVVNCNNGNITTFTDGCAVKPEEFVKAIIFHPSVKLDLTTTTLDDATIGLLTKKKLIYPFEVCLNIEPLDAKSNIEVQKNKNETKINDGLVKFNLKFKGNDCLEKAIRKMEGRNWGIGFVDALGRFWMDYSDNKLKGFEVQMLDVDGVKISDSSSATTSFMVGLQFSRIGTEGWNKRRVLIAPDVYDFYPRNGVEAVKLTNVTTTAANFTVKVVSGCDNSTPKEGLATANFRLVDTVTSLPVTATVSDLGGGLYKLSGAAVVAGTYTFQLYDSLNNLPVADILNTQFFQSNVQTVVLT